MTHAYDCRGVLHEIREGPAEFALDEELRAEILTGKRTRRLQNLSMPFERVDRAIGGSSEAVDHARAGQDHWGFTAIFTRTGAPRHPTKW